MTMMPSLLSCEACHRNVALDDRFCYHCGEKLPTEDLQIKYYFSQGYEYSVILEFLCRFHGATMSLRTLKNRLKILGLRRSTHFDEDRVRARIQQEVDGPGCMAGYRSMWHMLRCEGFMIPRSNVAGILREVDPDGCEERRRHRLKRRAYINPGPNFCWYMDGYDKLKPYGLPIHGCIDGFSRKMIWLKLSKSNNNPEVILKFYLDSVRILGGCPQKIRTDYGTENGLVAAAQCWFTNSMGSHIYGTSQHNQRIEGWWAYFRRSRMTWWINFFKDLVECSMYTIGNQIETECLWFCFADVIQEVSEIHCQHVEENHFIEDESNEYSEYFIYVMEQCELNKPQNWREALNLYNQLRYYCN